MTDVPASAAEAHNPSARGGLVYALIAFHYPPSTMVAAVRAWGLARELAETGNEVHVFTPVADGPTCRGVSVHVVEGAQVGEGTKAALGLPKGASLSYGLPRPLVRTARTAIRLAKEVLLFPDEARAWGDSCARAVESWLETSSCDVLISSAPPVSTHVAAMRARASRTRPIWIADWRDLWTAHPHYGFGRARRMRDLRLERTLVESADGHSASTRQMADILERQYPGTRVAAIYNGFDGAAYASNRPKQAGSGPLTLAYTGYLYEGKCSVKPLLHAVADLMAEGLVARDGLRLEFAGPPDAALQAGIVDLALEDVVHVHGVVLRSEVHDLLRDSDVLLVIVSDQLREASVVPAKTFEYIEARRPVLALNCLRSSELGSLLETTRTGTCVETNDGVRPAVLRLYREFTSSGCIELDPDDEQLARFTHARMAICFDELARDLLAESSGDKPDGVVGSAHRGEPS